MNKVLNWFGPLFVAGTLAASGQQSEQAAFPVMIVAVSRDLSALKGGIGYSKRSKSGTVDVEPVAFLTGAGEWQPIRCKSGTGEGCKKFEREYLSKRHIYTVISADGTGASIRTAPVSLSECYGYSGTGTYSGGHIANSAIAASSADPFASASALNAVTPSEAAVIRKVLRALVPKRLDSIEDLRVMHLQLEGMDLLVVQRAYGDNIDPKNFTRKLIFMIVHVEQERFVVLQRKQNMDDEQEQVLGTIRMENGKEFLVTSVSDPESQSFRVYGIRDGKLALVFFGGGSSC